MNIYVHNTVTDEWSMAVSSHDPDRDEVAYILDVLAGHPTWQARDCEIVQSDSDPRGTIVPQTLPTPLPDPDGDLLRAAMQDPDVPDYLKALVRRSGV